MAITKVDASYTVTGVYSREELLRVKREMQEFRLLDPVDRGYPEAAFDMLDEILDSSVGTAID